jgi:hypothetical protein
VPGVPDAGPAAGRIVAIRQGCVLATAFHPELTGDRRVHQLFCEMVRQSGGAWVRPQASKRSAGKDERPFEMGDDEAQEGSRRCQAR